MNYKFLTVLSAIILLNCTADKKNTIDSTYYTEKFRPQFHFTPEHNWMNDPNGMVYYEGEYHLFYQHYPDGNVWGPMHWGHAVSKDLIHWQHLPIALFPDSLGMIFSGSAVVDTENTSGLGSKENPAMVAIFTQHLMKDEKAGRHDFQNQSIAFSLDKGRTWKKYENNPVLKNPGKHDFRDPKVFWHESSKQWIMILAVQDHVELYGSPNLKSWKLLSEFGYKFGYHGGVWECPDLFELPIANTDNKKWVMLVSINPGAVNGGSGTQYFIGDFDGKKFTPDSKESQWIDYGKDNYAGVTWNNVPASDGRRLFLGWMSNWQYATVVPTTIWRSAMTLPRTLELIETDSGQRIASSPVKETTALRKDTASYTALLSAGEQQSREIILDSKEFEIDLPIDLEKGNESFSIELMNDNAEQLIIGFDGDANQFYIDRTKAGGQEFSKDFGGKHLGKRSFSNKNIRLKLFIDDSSVELFTDSGSLVMSELFFPEQPFTKLKLRSSKGVTANQMTLYSLKSIWRN
ncbi:MAG TPA: glycosyl hydrolase family 32 [Cytophagales bacterium]|jgi:fructan beta-fructosidase|nr:glycosyl hydrolase family 32 [Cytophagales bacterium]